MDIRDQIAICLENYNRWKQKALASGSRKAFEKAFFWLEVQTAFVMLHAIETTAPKDKETLEKLIQAKANLAKRLVEYAKETLQDLFL